LTFIGWAGTKCSQKLSEEISELNKNVSVLQKQIYTKELEVKSVEAQLLKIQSGDQQIVTAGNRMTELKAQIEQLQEENTVCDENGRQSGFWD